MERKSYEEKKNDAQIMRVDGNNCFVEIVNNAFSIGKLVMNFVSYDAESHKTIDKLEIYMDFDDAIGLAELILSGSLERKMLSAAQTGTFEGRQVSNYTAFYQMFTGKAYKQGESKFQELTARYPSLKNIGGQVILSKQVKIQKPMKNNYAIMLRAEYANGKMETTGAVSPAEKAFAFVNIPMTEVQALAFASMIKMSVQAYLNQFYARFCSTMFPNDTCKVFVPDRSMARNTPAASSTAANNGGYDTSGRAAQQPANAAAVQSSSPSPSPAASSSPQGGSANSGGGSSTASPHGVIKTSKGLSISVRFLENAMNRVGDSGNIAYTTAAMTKSDGTEGRLAIYFETDKLGERRQELINAIKNKSTMDITVRTVEGEDKKKYCYYVA